MSLVPKMRKALNLIFDFIDTAEELRKCEDPERLDELRWQLNYISNEMEWMGCSRSILRQYRDAIVEDRAEEAKQLKPKIVNLMDSHLFEVLYR